MKETTMQNVFTAGNIHQEVSEIKSMQRQADGYLTLWSETCAAFYSLFCC